MHALLDASGRVTHAGPTLNKLRPDLAMPGRRFLDLFESTRPRAVDAMAGLVAAPGGLLRLRFRDPPQTAFRGLIVPLPQGAGAIVNLSFGISVLDAVRDHALTSADFAATDLTIELLYLVEAKTAAMEASRSLNLRLQGAMIAAEEQAFTDTLTGLKNRRAADHVLDRLTGAGQPFALMHLDLDFFKAVNDSMGHAAGDHVLQQVARIMLEQIRSGDTVARVGGDEFLLIFHRLTDRARLSEIAARLIARVEAPIPYGRGTCRVSASIGIVFSDGCIAEKPAELLRRADMALYAAKRAGRGCARLFDPAMARQNPAPPPVTQHAPDGPKDVTGQSSARFTSRE
ncbi:MAG: diguanylate cyclase domain-containing protein [Jhaorihella sp.]